jgi:hypothetical protein
MQNLFHIINIRSRTDHLHRSYWAYSHIIKINTWSLKLNCGDDRVSKARLGNFLNSVLTFSKIKKLTTRFQMVRKDGLT